MDDEIKIATVFLMLAMQKKLKKLNRYTRAGKGAPCRRYPHSVIDRCLNKSQKLLEDLNGPFCADFDFFEEMILKEIDKKSR